jgi:hypothetical protein
MKSLSLDARIARAARPALVIALALAGPTACAPAVVSNYASVSTHTLKVAADKDTDVVWVQQYKGGDFALMRCYNAAGGPTCVRVKTP